MSLLVDIKKQFKGFTLSVQFESGGIPLGILGASGSGKSITLKCIAGIETPDEGHIEVNGRVLYSSAKKINLKPRKRQVGYLFQNYALFPNMTVEQNIACALGGNRADKSKVIGELVGKYKLAGLEKRYSAQLSGGQQQRVALARILAYNPQVLLLDEPFSALDAHLKEMLQIEMRDLLRDYDGDTILVTHNRDEAYRLCPSLMVLENGKAKAIGNTRDMFKNPGNVAVARLTGCKNISRAKKVAGNTVKALDWGCELLVEGEIPAGLTHVGVRAHFFTPCSVGNVNAIPVAITERIESPFEWNVLFCNREAESETSAMWWKYARENMWMRTPSIYVLHLKMCFC